MSTLTIDRVTTLAPVRPLDQQAIAKKIVELASQLSIESRIEVEGQISHSIAQELADKKTECGKNQHKWKEYLSEHDLTLKDAAKRIKMAKVSKMLWSVGALMVVQLCAPMFKDIREKLQEREVVTQEIVEAAMTNMRSLLNAEKKAKLKPENQPAVSIFKTDVNKIEFWELGKFYDMHVQGKALQDVIERSGKLPQTVVVDMIMHFINNPPDGYFINIPCRKDYCLSDIVPGARIKIIRGNAHIGEEGEVISCNGDGWMVLLDCHRNHEDPMLNDLTTFVRPSSIEIINIPQ